MHTSADLIMDLGDAVAPTNASTRIVPSSHRIPPEIIVKIIRALLPGKIRYGTAMQDRINDLLIATSICRYWRYAVLDHATLWSVVPVYRKTLGPLFLQRSRNVPLSIVFYADAPGACSAHQATVSLLPHIQRVRGVQLFAPSLVVNGIFSTLELYGINLDEIGLEINPPPSGEGWTVIIGRLLKHAPTLKILRLDAYEFRFPVNQFQQFPCLSHLELWGLHDLCDVSFLLTSFPTLASIKLGVEALGGHKDYHRLSNRIVPHPNLRHIHLEIGCYPVKVVLDTLKIRTGVHLECKIVGCRHWRTAEQVQFLPLSSKFLENTSQIEELRICGSVQFKCSGSGPSGSFCIKGFCLEKGKQPIEDFSHLQRLVVADVIEQGTLEGIVVSAPRLTSLTFESCTVSKSWAVDRAVKVLPSLDVAVDADTFVTTTSEERRADHSASQLEWSPVPALQAHYS
ncbi:hypothetical protein BDM02DRAFT_3127754 [Thelephora ganbajun]|uniref:Uncharacterized protein n=1 Tax=Thelephora ganbajun TaxID=370292 RepID=A0ACB6ZL27_THEGA|nr:hypothetical protein BDM02DRAFT_3127754 [Thelephora ganbajun]